MTGRVLAAAAAILITAFTVTLLLLQLRAADTPQYPPYVPPAGVTR